MRQVHFIALIALAGTPACTTFSLAEHSGPLPIVKHRRAQDLTAVVVPFSYEPSDPEETDALTDADLASVVVADASSIPPGTRYLITGSITKFNFQKNWVPTLFPLHIAASLFTFTAFTWLAGPTSVTDVDFGVRVSVVDLDTGQTIATFEEHFEDVSPVNIYTSGTGNPYNNPSLVFSKVVESLATRIAAALPELPSSTAERGADAAIARSD